MVNKMYYVQRANSSKKKLLLAEIRAREYCEKIEGKDAKSHKNSQKVQFPLSITLFRTLLNN